MAVTIKEIGNDQVERMAQIFLDCLQIQYKDILPSEIREAFTFNRSLELWQKSFTSDPTSKIIGAFVDGELAGFTKFGPSSSDSKVGYLASLYVSPDFGRRGIGRTLLEYALTQLQSYKRVQLWVFANNRPAISLYEALGFLATGIQKTEKEWGTLQILMELDNSQSRGTNNS